MTEIMKMEECLSRALPKVFDNKPKLSVTVGKTTPTIKRKKVY